MWDGRVSSWGGGARASARVCVCGGGVRGGCAFHTCRFSESARASCWRTPLPSSRCTLSGSATPCFWLALSRRRARLDGASVGLSIAVSSFRSISPDLSESSSLKSRSMSSRPDELVDYIIDFLLIDPVVPSAVRALGASSSAADERSSAAHSLDPDDGLWWISSQGSMPRGRGAEWIEYTDGGHLSPSGSARWTADGGHHPAQVRAWRRSSASGLPRVAPPAAAARPALGAQLPSRGVRRRGRPVPPRLAHVDDAGHGGHAALVHPTAHRGPPRAHRV